MWHLKLNFEAVEEDVKATMSCHGIRSFTSIKLKIFYSKDNSPRANLIFATKFWEKKGFFKVLVSENNHSKYKYQPHNFPSLICTHQVTYREASSLVLAH